MIRLSPSLLAIVLVARLAMAASESAAAVCGNGVVETISQAPPRVEECDDGNLVNGDGCSASCLFECAGGLTGTWLGPEFSGSRLRLVENAAGSITGYRDWDDGGAGWHSLWPVDGLRDASAITLYVNGTTCSGLRKSCTSMQTLCVGQGQVVTFTRASTSLCGDGVLQAGEACDDGNFSWADSCTPDCRAAACGDGFVQPGEACDDGNLVNGDGCSATCTIQVCGNGVLEAGEACDDGNTVNRDGCSADCKVQVCGNGTLESGEECDDGNLLNGDGCSPTCALDFSFCAVPGLTGTWQSAGGELHLVERPNGSLQGVVFQNSSIYPVSGQRSGVTVTGLGSGCQWKPCDTITCNGGGSASRISTKVCGNGVLESGEQCDDGNFDPFDACSLRCEVIAQCGDGVVAGAETCDDGNLVSGDGCDANCKPTGCGNSVVTAGETCDDGNTIPGDGCNQNCRAIECGDGVVTPGSLAFCGAGRSCVDTCDGGWSYPFGITPAREGELYASLVDGDAFVFGGYFGSPGGFEDVASWSNGTWTPLGQGFADGTGCAASRCESAVYALARIGKSIYAGGEIFAVGGSGASLSGIARWDGQAWSSVGGGVASGGLKGTVNSLLAVGTDLYAAGDFDQAGGVAATGIARWDGSAWSAVGGGMVAPAGERAVGSALAELDGEIYVGGVFSGIGGVVAANVARWDGTQWHAVGAGVPGRVHALASGSGKVFAGGEGWIAQWDGTSWTTLWSVSTSPGDPPGRVTAMVVMDGQLYVSGRGFALGRAAGVARWDGANWSSLGSGLQSSSLVNVRGMTADRGRLVVTGSFARAGGRSSSEAVIWTERRCGEQCDDGNSSQGDGCDSNCTVTACGNGIVSAGESCDDGNLVNGDGCDSNCSTSRCGNGIAAGGEACDDGNGQNGDGCEADCTLTPVTRTVAAGATLRTPPLSAAFPVETAVTSPVSGVVSIRQAAPGVVVGSGFAVVGKLIDITAPAATVTAPLVVSITVGLGEIPPGVAPAALGVTRDGTAVGDCTGTAGAASPDPCIASRTVDATSVEVRVLTSHASIWGAVTPAFTSTERKCALGGTKAAAGVAKTQLKGAAKCVALADAGKVIDLGACFSRDAGAKTGKSMAKTASAVSKCPGGVPIGFAGATEANIAAFDGALGVVAAVLGRDANQALVDSPSGDGCRAALMSAVGKVFDTEAKVFLACEFARMSAVQAARDLEVCFDEVASDLVGKIAGARAKMAKTLEARCASPGLLTGPCAGAVDRASCIGRLVDCETCRMFNGIGGLSRDCDRFDDGAVNGSCW